MCRSKYVEPSVNFGIINSVTRLHVVGYFYDSYYDARIHELKLKKKNLLPYSPFCNKLFAMNFDVSLTVHLSITLANDQLHAQIFNTFITILYMNFRFMFPYIVMITLNKNAN